MKKFNVNKMLPNVKGFGVTATPQRADGKGFDVPVEGPSIRDMVNADLLTDYPVFVPPSDSSPVKVVNIDGIIDYVERKTGRKVVCSSFDNNTFTAHLSGDIEPVNITATISFKFDD